MHPIRSLLKVLSLLMLLAVPLSGCTALTVYNDVVPQDRAKQVRISDVAYGSARRQKLDIYLPNKDVKNADVVVFFYGGSWKLGRKEELSFVANSLAQRGFVVVVPDYRLVPEVRYPDFIKDTAKAIAWTYRNVRGYGGNPRRMFVSGHSAGAYNAVMTALAPEFLGGEGLSPSVMRGVIGISGPYDFLPFQYIALHRAFDSAAPNLEVTQPVYRARKAGGVPPMLLIAGAGETMVPAKNTEELASILRQRGKRVDVKIYPGARHLTTLLAFSKPRRNEASVLDDIVAWMKRH